VLAAVTMPLMLASTLGQLPEGAIGGAVAIAVLALAWRGIGRPGWGIAVAIAAAAGLIAKPWYAPVVRAYDGQLHRLSPTSETHLYYVLPGIGLAVLALGLISALKLRQRATPVEGTGASPAHNDAIALAPPRPAPPRPEPPKPG
jgi:hypothetical protein